MHPNPVTMHRSRIVAGVNPAAVRPREFVNLPHDASAHTKRAYGAHYQRVRCRCVSDDQVEMQCTPLLCKAA
jgi:hypothetical protein